MLKAIIVDDEQPARQELKFLIEEAGGIEVVDEADCATQAIESLKNHPCDVLFLDINMPDANGMNLAKAISTLKYPPCVVFVTAYSEYAVDAFDVKAVDYLLKPVELDRLKRAIKKVEDNVRTKVKIQKSKSIPCEKSGKRVMIATSDIKYCVARDDYAYVVTDEGKFFSTISLSQIERELEGFEFMRVHRGYLVSLNDVAEIETTEAGGMNIRLKGIDELIPVSRRKIPKLKQVLNI